MIVELHEQRRRVLREHLERQTANRVAAGRDPTATLIDRVFGVAIDDQRIGFAEQVQHFEQIERQRLRAVAEQRDAINPDQPLIGNGRQIERRAADSQRVLPGPADREHGVEARHDELIVSRAAVDRGLAGEAGDVERVGSIAAVEQRGFDPGQAVGPLPRQRIVGQREVDVAGRSHEVHTVTAVDRIVAESAIDNIVVDATVDRIVAGTTDQRVAAGTTEQRD